MGYREFRLKEEGQWMLGQGGGEAKISINVAKLCSKFGQKAKKKKPGFDRAAVFRGGPLPYSIFAPE